MSKPLSDSQVEILFSAARPLPPSDHAAFLEDVTNALASCPELGDGVIYRTVRELQRKYWSPPPDRLAVGPTPHRR